MAEYRSGPLGNALRQRMNIPAGSGRIVARDVDPEWLAEHDREVAVRTVDAFAEMQEQITAAHDYAMDETDWDEHKRFTASIRAYAAAIRSGRVPVPKMPS